MVLSVLSERFQHGSRESSHHTSQHNVVADIRTRFAPSTQLKKPVRCYAALCVGSVLTGSIPPFILIGPGVVARAAVVGRSTNPECHPRLLSRRRDMEDDQPPSPVFHLPPGAGTDAW
jgi:hypothetical protein